MYTLLRFLCTIGFNVGWGGGDKVVVMVVVVMMVMGIRFWWKGRGG